MINVQQLLDAKPSQLITITQNQSVQDALELMAKHRIISLPVVDGSKLIGIISDRDYIYKAAIKRIAPWDILVSEIMTDKVISVISTDSIQTCMDYMCNNSIRHLPVMRGLALIGLVSITDVLSALRQPKSLKLNVAA